MHETGLRQLKGNTKKAQETKGRYVLLKQPVMQQESCKFRIAIHDQRDGTPGNPEWRVIKGGNRENLQPSRNEFCLFGKNDKERTTKSWVWKGEKLGKTRNQELLPKYALEWTVSHGLLKKQHQKEETMRNRERISLLGDRHITGFGT